jgi:hypothetical protein
VPATLGPDLGRETRFTGRKLAGIYYATHESHEMNRKNALSVVAGKDGRYDTGMSSSTLRKWNVNPRPHLSSSHDHHSFPQKPSSAMLKRPRHDNTPLVVEPDLPANVVSHPARVGRDLAVVKDELRPGGDLLERVQLKTLEVLANCQYLHTNSPTLKRHRDGMDVPCCTS